MKSFVKLTSLAFISLLFSSCCGLGIGNLCDKGGSSTGCGSCKTKNTIAKAECENNAYEERIVTKYKTVKRTINPGSKSGKGGIPYEIDEQVAYQVTERVPVETTCGSKYCPDDQPCGVISQAVLKRATAQGASGEPHIGTIPTMKVLAP